MFQQDFRGLCRILEVLARFSGILEVLLGLQRSSIQVKRILEVLAGFSWIMEVSAGFQRS